MCICVCPCASERRGGGCICVWGTICVQTKNMSAGLSGRTSGPWVFCVFLVVNANLNLPAFVSLKEWVWKVCDKRVCLRRVSSAQPRVRGSVWWPRWLPKQNRDLHPFFLNPQSLIQTFKWSHIWVSLNLPNVALMQLKIAYKWSREDKKTNEFHRDGTRWWSNAKVYSCYHICERSHCLANVVVRRYLGVTHQKNTCIFPIT